MDHNDCELGYTMVCRVYQYNRVWICGFRIKDHKNILNLRRCGLRRCEEAKKIKETINKTWFKKPRS